MNRKNILKQHIGYWLNRLRTCVHYRFEGLLAEFEISVPAWNIMIAVYDGSAKSINELAHYIEIDKAAVSRTVEKLVLNNILTHKEGADRRSGVIELTPKGIKLVPKLIQAAEENEQHFFGFLPKEEILALQKTMQTIFAKKTNIKFEGFLNEK